MSKVIRSTLSVFVGLVIGAFSFAVVPAMADDPPQETGSLYAFAVQPADCHTPGYVHINAAQGATWTLDGAAATVAEPSSDFSQPGGFQGDVTAHAEPGFSIPADAQSSFFLTVNPMPACATVDQSGRVNALEAQVARQRAQLDRQETRIAGLQSKVDRQRQRITHLRDRLRN